MNQLPTARPSLNGWNPEYLEEQYRRWQADPESVPHDWGMFFTGFDLARAGALEGGNGASAPSATSAASPTADDSELIPRLDSIGEEDEAPSGPAFPSAPSGISSLRETKQSRVYSLIRTYRRIGHFAAQLNPLSQTTMDFRSLRLERYGLDESDLQREYDAEILRPARRAKLGELIDFLRATYCGHIGAEFMHIQNRSERTWILDRLEPIAAQPTFDHVRHRQLLTKIRLAEGFEKYLHTKYVGQKRFSLEGGEAAIVALDAIVTRAADEHGARNIVMGMAHRGRLNVLVNILGKSYRLVFSEFEDNYLPNSAAGSGDVKYHKGYSGNHTTEQGNEIHLTLTANPSHLEAVDPVVEGRARARQMFHTRQRLREGDAAPFEPRVLEADRHFNPIARPATLAYPDPRSRHDVVPVLIHGDAAFAGQGVVWETLNLSQLEAYTTGGTVHVVINNQIGFTTLPEDARSSYYCTDIAKGIEAPVFHVNGDDPQAVAFVTELALDYRQTFGKDVVVDIICYRRWGHNEADEPAFTQPLMYDRVRQHPTVSERYAEELLKRGEMTEAELKLIDETISEMLGSEQEEAKAATHTQILRMVSGLSHGGLWEEFSGEWSYDPVETAVDDATLRDLAARLVRVPEGFEAHRKIQRLMKQRLDAVEGGRPLDWATGESLAFASLLAEGTPIRMSGQDARRGTFSHRHAVFVDVTNGTEHMPLQHIADDAATQCEIWESNLSEYAVLGFEFGVSLGDPRTLVIWEAQFGDFVNGAQIIIDQFITSCEAKWGRCSGLVMLLPHGYEGQGPEHSSARLERFLQSCAQENCQVVYPTTTAQYFHVLRRQMKRKFRKPLVIMSPKSLLRLPAAMSPLGELSSGTFQEVADDPNGRDDARRLILCSGKVYHDLVAYRAEGTKGDDGEERADNPRAKTAIVRIEQLYPLHERMLSEVIARYGQVEEIVWVQEEPANMGAWTFIAPRLRSILGETPRYVGRAEAASPAAGSLLLHRTETARLLAEAFGEEVPAS